MRNTIGIPAQAGNFLERKQETQELWHKATRGHVLMLAPRRVGKTSLLYHMRDKPIQDWVCLFMSVESAKNEAQFVARLLTELCAAHPDGAWLQRFGATLRGLLRSIGQAGVGPLQVQLVAEIHDDWQEVGATALSVLQELRGKTLVLVDEFPIFIRRLLEGPEGKERTQLFLNWFRETRNTCNNVGVETYFLLTGSLGLDAVVRAVGMSGTINDLDTFYLGPLTDEQAETLLVKLSEGEDLPLTPEIRQRIRQHIDWPTPFHLQLLFANLLSLVKYQGHELTVELVDNAYGRLLGLENRKHFSHWVERLDESLLTPKERELKKQLLEAAARDPHGIVPSTIVQIREQYGSGLNERDILANLEHDGYLTMHGERWRFTSSLLRDWWCKWQVKT
jgi:hypothetical protein